MCRVDNYDSDGEWLAEPHEVVARKDHKCEDCRRVIAKGETYTYGSWVGSDFDGVMPVKMCQQCVAAGRWLQVVCGGHLWPGVIEELREHWDEEWDLRSFGLGRLILWGQYKKWTRPDGSLITLDEIKRWTDQALSRVPAEARH